MVVHYLLFRNYLLLSCCMQREQLIGHNCMGYVLFLKLIYLMHLSICQFSWSGYAAACLFVLLTNNMYQGKTENAIQSNSVRHTMEKVQQIVGEHLVPQSFHPFSD